MTGRNEDSAKPPVDAIWRHVDELCDSALLYKADQLAKMLRLIVERSLARERLTGREIGILAFGRPLDFNPTADGIVGVQKIALVAKIAEYYNTNTGSRAKIRIEVDERGYGANIRWADGYPALNAGSAIDTSSPSDLRDSVKLPAEAVAPAEKTSDASPDAVATTTTSVVCNPPQSVLDTGSASISRSKTTLIKRVFTVAINRSDRVSFPDGAFRERYYAAAHDLLPSLFTVNCNDGTVLRLLKILREDREDEIHEGTVPFIVMHTIRRSVKVNHELLSECGLGLGTIAYFWREEDNFLVASKDCWERYRSIRNVQIG